jgi:hypothetical protein
MVISCLKLDMLVEDTYIKEFQKMILNMNINGKHYFHTETQIKKDILEKNFDLYFKKIKSTIKKQMWEYIKKNNIK